jgi:hypothetical protein
VRSGAISFLKIFSWREFSHMIATVFPRKIASRNGRQVRQERRALATFNLNVEVENQARGNGRGGARRLRRFNFRQVLVGREPTAR